MMAFLFVTLIWNDCIINVGEVHTERYCRAQTIAHGPSEYLCGHIHIRT